MVKFQTKVCLWLTIMLYFTAHRGHCGLYGEMDDVAIFRTLRGGGGGRD